MDIKMAMSIFNIQSITLDQEKEINKIYKRLARTYHPDVSKVENSDAIMITINDAYAVIKETLNELKDIEKINKVMGQGISRSIVIITGKDLLNLYKGINAKSVLDGKPVEITKSNVNKYNTYISLDANIMMNGLSRNVQALEKKNRDDIYEIRYVYQTTDISRVDEAKITVYGKEITLKLSSLLTTATFNIDYLMNIKVFIEKKLLKREEKRRT